MVSAVVLVKLWVPNTPGFTDNSNRSLPTNTPSLTVTWMVAVPVWPGGGITWIVRTAPLPPKRILLLGTRVGLEDSPLTSKFSTAVSASPTVKATGVMEVLMLVLWSGMSEIVGTGLTPWTTMATPLTMELAQPLEETVVLGNAPGLVAIHKLASPLLVCPPSLAIDREVSSGPRTPRLTRRSAITWTTKSL